ncbi:hypothetical protein VKT23_008634 [Stygiomarasmius scandens]|uniref:Uncharacterized protein n=1 Tax=Marasmiellus scandens TaxID=2682957 RepID=A0ABR1JK93_9AGAR
MWPIYMYLGNLSKYIRCQPSSYSAHHIAYVPSLPARFQDLYREIFGVAATSDELTHSRRELMHAVLAIIFNPAFREAYLKGVVVQCADKMLRRFFLRLFSYSCDYVEKVLLVAIMFLSDYPCPTCLVYKGNIRNLGMVYSMCRLLTDKRVDTAERQGRVFAVRKLVFEKGYSIRNKRMLEVLKKGSYVPTLSFLSAFLLPLGINMYDIFPIDVLHDIELGKWRDVFTHLCRILQSIDKTQLAELNKRYRDMPMFGHDTIRPFKDDVSDMKSFAARNFEDLLQLSPPAFEGLFGNKKQEKIIQDLLFDMLTFHAHAKLRIHTNSTLESFQLAIKALGQLLCHFQTSTCAFYSDTKELPREQSSRIRKEANKAKKKKSKVASGSSNEIQGKAFSMETYKTHALSHYAEHAEKFGTADSNSTRNGESAHRFIKFMYGLASKNDHTASIAVLEQRTHHLRWLSKGLPIIHKKPKNPAQKLLSIQHNETLPPTDPSLRYHIANSQKNWTSIYKLISLGKGDPALHEFKHKLELHLLKRLLPNDTELDLDTIGIVNKRIYLHQTVRFNYTTYDCRRDQDSVNPKRHADIMMLSADTETDSHPYIYARVIGVYHVNVRHWGPKSTSSKVQRMDILFVRWFQRDMTYQCGWEAKRLPRLQFLPSNDEDAFGFVDPNTVIRGCHLLPGFAHGYTNKYLDFPDSVGQVPRLTTEGLVVDEDDWKYYYVGIAIDRDMWMRYRGGGVGHMSTQKLTKPFEQEALGKRSKGKQREEVPEPDEVEDNSDNEEIDAEESAKEVRVEEVEAALSQPEEDSDEESEEEGDEYSDKDTDADAASDMGMYEEEYGYNNNYDDDWD